MNRSNRLQRALLGAVLGVIAGLLNRRVRRKIAAPVPRGHIEASDR